MRVLVSQHAELVCPVSIAINLVIWRLVIACKPRRVLKSLLEKGVQRANLSQFWHLQARHCGDCASHLRLLDFLITLVVIEISCINVCRKQELLLKLGTHVGFEIIGHLFQWQLRYSGQS